MTEIVLYDIPSRSSAPKCWGPNTWKARSALNFKRLTYATRWLEYPDIAPFLKAEGLAPNQPPTPPYSCPTVKFADGALVMDSLKIAHELDKRHPDPPLHSHDPIVGHVVEILSRLSPILAPALLPQVPRNLLNPVSQEHFERTRAVRFGMPLSAFEESKGASAFEDARPVIIELAGLLQKDTSGPFFLGATPSFADLVVASQVEFMRRLNPDTLNKFLAFDHCFEGVHSACKVWLEKDG